MSSQPSHQPISRSSYHRTPQLGLSPTELFEAMQVCHRNPPMPTCDSSIRFRILASSVRCLPIPPGRISCAIKSRVYVNVLLITITIICSPHSRHQFQAVRGVPFYGVFPRALGDAALHASPAWSFPAREMPDGLLSSTVGILLRYERDAFPTGCTKNAAMSYQSTHPIRRTRLALICGAKPGFRIVSRDSWQVWLCDSHLA